jgi:hypothetical protein
MMKPIVITMERSSTKGQYDRLVKYLSEGNIIYGGKTG